MALVRLSDYLIPLLLAGAAIYALGRRVDVFSALTTGAGEGLRIVLRILRAGAQGAGDRNAESVRLIMQRGGDFSFLIHRVDRKGKITAFFQAQHALHRQTLAAHRAVDIVQVNVNMFRLRVTFQIIGHFYGNVVLQGVNFFIQPETRIKCARE